MNFPYLLGPVVVCNFQIQFSVVPVLMDDEPHAHGRFRGDDLLVDPFRLLLEVRFKRSVHGRIAL